MNRTKMLAWVVIACVTGTTVFQFVRLHSDSQRLAAENASLQPLANALPPLNEEITRLAPIRAALAATHDLEKEREARRKDQTDAKTLQLKLDEYKHKEVQATEKLRMELDSLKARVDREGDLPNTNAWRVTAVSQSISIRETLNKGNATPENLLETWLWAVKNSQAGQLYDLHFLPDVPAESGQRVSPEVFLELDEMWFSDVAEVLVTEKRFKGEDEAVLEFDLKRDRDPLARESTGLSLQLKRIGSKWKILSVSGRRRD